MKLILISIFLSLIVNNTVAPTVAHPVHISVINIDYKESTEEFELLIKVFTDDFENFINKEFNTGLKLTEENIQNNISTIDTFLKNHFIVYFNNKKISKKYKIFTIIHNKDQNTTEIKYKFKHKIPNRVKVFNNLFINRYNDQKNLFIFTCGKTLESFKFDNKEIEFEFNLK